MSISMPFIRRGCRISREAPNGHTGQTHCNQLRNTQGSPNAAAKEGLRRGAESSMEKEWATNVLAQAMLLGTQDFAEGLAAVVERRPGVFTGE